MFGILQSLIFRVKKFIRFSDVTSDKMKSTAIIFCIENVADKLNIDAPKVYSMLTEQTNILNEYIIPEYEILHTQSKDYIINDIIEVMKERGVEI